MVTSSKEAYEKGIKYSDYDKNILGKIFSEPYFYYFEPITYKGKYIEVLSDDTLKLIKLGGDSD